MTLLTGGCGAKNKQIDTHFQNSITVPSSCSVGTCKTFYFGFPERDVLALKQVGILCYACL
jgi:hypothetical protein